MDGVPASALASVQPYDAEEVGRLAMLAARHSVPLVAFGAGTGFGPQPPEGGIVVRFDLMRAVRSPDPDEPWIEAEPGATWLELEDVLRPRGWGLAVYPTSAPRATVGGWLARDGLGVGSFEHGWLRENVVSASVVMGDGERREVSGEELGSFFVSASSGGIIVGAKLGTRRADTDVPYAASFADAKSLAGAVAGVLDARLPLWHLALLNPAMARARASADAHLLFGAYPREREARVAGPLREVVETIGGRVLDAPDPRAHGPGARLRRGPAGGLGSPLTGGRAGHGGPLGRGATARPRRDPPRRPVALRLCQRRTSLTNKSGSDLSDRQKTSCWWRYRSRPRCY